MSYISNEFIYFDPEYSGQGDFTDNLAFTPEERREFLSRYAAFLKKGYGLPDKSLRVVEPCDAAKRLAQFDLQRGLFSDMQAYALPMPQPYKDWRFYTDKVKRQGETLVFASADLPPNPNAQLSLSGEERPRTLSFKILMDEEYAAPINGVVRDTTTARTLELRRGIEDILKISLFSNGQAYARVFSANSYHSRFISLGGFEFGREFELTLTLGEEDYSVILGGVTTENIPYSSTVVPDRLFISSGMFSFGSFTVTPLEIAYSDRVITEFFAPADPAYDEKTCLGQVTLPYAIGGAELADKMLVLEKIFTLPHSPRVSLKIDSLDPGGEVYIDGALFAATDGFDSFDLDLSHLERGVEHTLQVRVFPRAPEVLFGWHRQQDPYNGWFCGEIHLETGGDIALSDVKVATLSVEGDSITAEFSGTVTRPCEIKVTATPVWAAEGDRTELGRISAQGSFARTLSFKATPWDTKTPALYELEFTLISEGEEYEGGKIETGFRTIEQKNGEILLNGSRIDLKGALLMQFLPPYRDTSRYHICPTDEQVLWQELMLKSMGGNTLRLHVLGYGVNDPRYARYADRLGLLLIWTTRYIDSIEGVQWQGKWRGREAFLNQMKAVINHPSIIMWEGSNELRPDIKQINSAFDNFVPAVKGLDKTRLICPVSHLYYAADLYPTRGCEYLSEDGVSDHKGDPAQVSPYWNDSSVVRSAHTYNLLCGYGTGWDKLRLQPWGEQERLFSSKKHAYIVSEYAVIGRQDPNTPEAVEEYFNPYSYEFPDEKSLGLELTGADWLISQAHQALCAHHAVKTLRERDADGMLWCCLMGGANDGGYLKPVIDNYGYAKLGFYAMRAALDDTCLFTRGVGVKQGGCMSFKPLLWGEAGRRYTVTLTLTDGKGQPLETHIYKNVLCEKGVTPLAEYIPATQKKSYYGLIAEIK